MIKTPRQFGLGNSGRSAIGLNLKGKGKAGLYVGLAIAMVIILALALEVNQSSLDATLTGNTTVTNQTYNTTHLQNLTILNNSRVINVTWVMNQSNATGYMGYLNETTHWVQYATGNQTGISFLEASGVNYTLVNISYVYASSDLGTSATTLIDLIPLVFAAVLILAVVAFAMLRKRGGMIGGMGGKGLFSLKPRGGLGKLR